jgi:hypothetical protein
VLYRGSFGEWQTQFAITRPGTRRNQLKALLHHIFRQVGVNVARQNAEAQRKEANPVPRATLAEHLQEFDDLWTWTAQQWHAELADAERERFDGLTVGNDRDTFKIIRSFAAKAESDGSPDFPFPVEHVAARLGISFQAVCKIRTRFVELRIIEKTANCVPNRTAARFRWIAPMSADERF